VAAPNVMASADLRSIVARHRIIVCAGSGGVGKTTTAAALALFGAINGRKAMVLTIDPARRLADSLGVGPIGNTPRLVPDKVFASLGVEVAGSLSAMMLDQKGSWDELVSRHAPSPEVREQILANRFYRQLSQSFAGSQEYMAVEQLGELDATGKYDLIVVDTPPTQHALDFLEAPDRLLDFLDKRIIRWFVKPSLTAGWSAFKAVNKTVGFLLHRIEEATGVAALAEVTDFFGAMSGLFDGFEVRVARVTELLRDATTGFLLVAGPDEQVLDQIDFLVRQMAARRMPLKGVVMNRVRPFVADADSDDPRELAARIAPAIASLDEHGAAGEASLAERLARNFVAYQARARGDALRIEMFRQGLPRGVPIVQVPNLPADIHDLHGLIDLHPYLFGAAR
jgi:anion-transporting  ArsA/GET3 family ATPase